MFSLLLLVPQLARADAAMLTLVDGEATVIDGARRVAGVAGLPLAAGAIVECTAASTIVRIEWLDGAVVDLGGGARVMVAPPGIAPRGGAPPLVYLLQGSVKVSGAGRDPNAGLLTPTMDLLPFAGAAVVVVDRREAYAFAETGSFEIVERPGGKRTGVATGALYAGAAGVLPRPSAEWLAHVPRAFRDPIPRRAAALAKQAVSGTALPPPTYAQVAHWLTAEPAVRKAFPQRFASWAADPAFRRELLAHESAHPEWRPLLHPPPPPSSSPPPAPASSARPPPFLPPPPSPSPAPPDAEPAPSSPAAR